MWSRYVLKIKEIFRGLFLGKNLHIVDSGQKLLLLAGQSSRCHCVKEGVEPRIELALITKIMLLITKSDLVHK